MLDNRMYTFLELCNTMNYHKAADALNMTQPAVTQHIKYLEDLYGCKLFDYSSRKLIKTEKCIELEKHTRTVISMDLSVKKVLANKSKISINIGATKTIGEYALDKSIYSLISENKYNINLVIDNTQNLLNKLNHFELDIILLEGFLDKNKYNYKKISDEEIVGICSKNHRFANKEISFEDIFNEKTVLRENGSGTKKVFETFLQSKGYDVSSFKSTFSISSNRLIEKIVENNLSVSFVYNIIAKQNKNLATFNIKGYKILHEFNYVFLDKSKANEIMKLI